METIVSIVLIIIGLFFGLIFLLSVLLGGFLIFMGIAVLFIEDEKPDEYTGTDYSSTFKFWMDAIEELEKKELNTEESNLYPCDDLDEHFKKHIINKDK